MSSTIVAIEAAIALTTLAARLSESASIIQTTIQRAQTEGRDLTDAEIESIQNMRYKAIQRLDNL